MKFLILFSCILAAASAVSFFDMVKEEWNAFKMQHSKSFRSDTEERFRMKIFVENKHRIARHNQKYAMGLVSFTVKENEYSDMLHHEFVHTFNGFNKSSTGKILSASKADRHATFMSPANVQVPDHIDWSKKGAVTPVKNQGKCGSCWSFSTTGALEGQHFRQTGVLVSLSEQNLIDCSTAYGNNGCNGGLMDNAFQYIKDNGGIDTESSYPYEAMDDKCRYNPKDSGADDVGLVDIPQGDEEKLKEAIATVGPVSVAIDASQESFQFYNSGVYYDDQCSNVTLDHGVLAVGYGTDEEGGDYWLIKNSWGSSWGIDGFIKMARNRDNHCGVATSASYPLV